MARVKSVPRSRETVVNAPKRRSRIKTVPPLEEGVKKAIQKKIRKLSVPVEGVKVVKRKAYVKIRSCKDNKTNVVKERIGARCKKGSKTVAWRPLTGELPPPAAPKKTSSRASSKKATTRQRRLIPRGHSSSEEVSSSDEERIPAPRKTRAPKPRKIPFLLQSPVRRPFESPSPSVPRTPSPAPRKHRKERKTKPPHYDLTGDYLNEYLSSDELPSEDEFPRKRIPPKEIKKEEEVKTPLYHPSPAQMKTPLYRPPSVATPHYGASPSYTPTPPFRRRTPPFRHIPLRPSPQTPMDKNIVATPGRNKPGISPVNIATPSPQRAEVPRAKAKKTPQTKTDSSWLLEERNRPTSNPFPPGYVPKARRTYAKAKKSKIVLK